MKFNKVLLCAIILYVSTASLAQKAEVECIPIKQCPQLLKLLATNELSEDNIIFLRESHCGFHPDNNQPMVWCSRMMECKTPLNEEGSCKDIKSCPYLLNLLRVRNDLDPKFKKYLQEHKCNGNLSSSEVKVCCPKLQNGISNGSDDNDNKRTIVSKSRNEEEYFPCETPDHVKGSCKLVKNCATFQQLLRTVDLSKEEIRKSLRKYRCSGKENEGITVCCTDKTKSGKSSNNNKNFSFKNYKGCGRNSLGNSRIFGGVNVELGEYPWMARLNYTSETGKRYVCGGSLIDNRHILTAAHCLDKQILEMEDIFRLPEIILGEYDARTDPDCITSEYRDDCADRIKKYKVESFRMHESFNRSIGNGDIAIIRLDRNVKFSAYVRPICLPTDGTFSLRENEWFTIAGWGRWNSTLGVPSTTLRKANVKLTERSRCSFFGDDRIICTIGASGVGTCGGDSGGPLMLEFLDSSGYSTKSIGVVSYGTGTCGISADAYVYVPFYMDWISQTISELENN